LVQIDDPESQPGGSGVELYLHRSLEVRFGFFELF
jgi:hypothetical protein